MLLIISNDEEKCFTIIDKYVKAARSRGSQAEVSLLRVLCLMEDQWSLRVASSRQAVLHPHRATYTSSRGNLSIDCLVLGKDREGNDRQRDREAPHAAGSKS